MKPLLILTALLLTACSDFDADIQELKDRGKQEIVNECQDNGYFKYGILTFGCHQMFVVGELNK